MEVIRNNDDGPKKVLNIPTLPFCSTKLKGKVSIALLSGSLNGHCKLLISLRSLGEATRHDNIIWFVQRVLNEWALLWVYTTRSCTPFISTGKSNYPALELRTELHSTVDKKAFGLDCVAWRVSEWSVVNVHQQQNKNNDTTHHHMWCETEAPRTLNERWWWWLINYT